MNTYFDVTHILGWHGNLTGIERVELNLIQYYIENTDAHFVVWNMSLKRWVKIKDHKIRGIVLEYSDNKSKKRDGSGNRIIVIGKIITGKLNRLRDYQKVTIQKNDRLIVPAGVWDNHGYIKGILSLAKNEVKIVHIIYDMIPVVEPEMVLGFMPRIFRNYMMQVLPACTLLLAISEASANDTIKFLQESKKKIPEIKTFRLGDDMIVSPSNKALINEDKPFCLMVGTFEIRKNHMLLYYVYKSAASKGIQLPVLVIVGKKGWLTESVRHLFLKDPAIKEKIIMTGAIGDNELARLYEKAAYTVVPSLYEGWGLQVTESLARGTIVLASNISSLPEVGGDSCDYFSPYSPDELLELMQKYSSSKKRELKKAEIKVKYKKNDWKDAAKYFAKLAGGI